MEASWMENGKVETWGKSHREWIKNENETKTQGIGQKSDIPFSGRGPRGGDPGEEAAPPPLGLLQQGKTFFVFTIICYAILII